MRLKEITVRGLFYRSDHKITTHLDERITILTGPNGSGKTMILRILYALFAEYLWSLSRFPFRELQIEFDTGSVLSVQKHFEPSESSPRPKASHLEFRYKENGKETDSYQLTPPPSNRAELPFSIGSIEDIVPELDQRGPNLWINLATDEALSLEQVIDQYWEQLPFDKSKRADTPDWLVKIRETPVRLIETDRLFARGSNRQNSRNWVTLGAKVFHGEGPRETSSLAVKKYAAELSQIIRQTTTSYGEKSQSLDRTFPSRVVSEEGPTLTEDELRKELEEIETKRANLVTAGLLAEERSYLSLNVSKRIDPSKVGVLSVYVRDAKQKLQVFEEILPKVELFKEIIHERFVDKRLSVSSAGFAVGGKDGGPLPLSLLSSGEQHELVLFYELLFHVSPGSLILIDEPEISLHIAWQEAFLEDLIRVANTSQFDAIVATHSPQIINVHENLTVSLSDLRGGVRTNAESDSDSQRSTTQA